MLFNTAHFEQHIDATDLQKGLVMFRRGKVDLLQHPSRNEYRFFCGNKELVLRKSGHRLLEYSCACGKVSNCEHLAAALFYFDPGLADEFDLKRLRRAADPLKLKFDAMLKEVREEAADAIRKNDPREFVQLVEKKTRRGAEGLGYGLVVFSEKWFFESLRDSAGKQTLDALYKKLGKSLHAAWKKGLSAAEKKLWGMATLNSLRKNQALASESFYFLGLRRVFLMRDKREFLEWHQLLHQRKYTKGFGQAFDYLAVLKFATELREDPKKLSPANNNPELLIARAELFGVKDKPEKAASLLREKGKEVRREHPEYYADYLAYLETLALNHHLPAAKLYVMREKFLHHPFINENDLDHYIRLSGSGAAQELDLLIVELKEARRFYSFQKLSLVLLKAKRYAELIAEIRKEPNQFKLLHKVMLVQLPHFDAKQFPLYIKHLLKAIEEARYHQLQLSIFNEARTYIDRLPDEVGAALLGKLSDHLGHQSLFAKFLNTERTAINGNR